MRRLVHLGLGNFARAHLLDYTAQAGGWTVTGVSLRNPTIRDGLAVQGNRYTLAVHGQPAREIDIIDRVLVAPEDPQTVIDAIAAADLISLTVTEKGYHLDAQGALDLNDPAIAADLAGGARSAIALLVRGLEKRTVPVTILSCDNRTGNGDALAAAINRFAQAAGVTIPVAFTCPNAMVDRITPATTDALRRETGDPMAVPTEPFREWVLEDRFIGPHPDWPDVQLVQDVSPHEVRKLRMLNGAHSYLAYAGCLAGHTYVHEAVRDPVLRARVQTLMAEAAETLPLEIQPLTQRYAAALMARFENPGLRHALRQIAMDGTQKLPYRIVAPLRWHVEHGTRDTALAEALEAWVTFCQIETRVDDPMAEQIATATPAQLYDMIGAADLRPG